VVQPDAAGPATTAQPTASATRNLAIATWAFFINFWAWNLVGPLSSTYSDSDHMSLNSTHTSLLVATPVLVGSVGRIPVGALTDRYGGRVMFTILSLVSIVPVCLVALAGHQNSYGLMLLFGLFLGIAGTTFAVGIPFVNAWHASERRGLATGIFGAGMGGTAASAFFTPRFLGWFGYVPTHLIIAAALLLTAGLVWVAARDAPQWRPNVDPVVPKLAAAARLPITWAMAFLYAVAFGGFVAFATYLPTYLKTIYLFSQTEAGTRTAGFAAAAVIARPLGGILSDRLHPKPIVLCSLVGAAVMALVVATQPGPEVPAGISVLAMAFFLGIGTGGVFAWVARRAPLERVGAVTGIVGAAGGLGVYFPPLVMGATYDQAENDYGVGLVLLCLTALVAFVFTLFGLNRAKETESARLDPARLDPGRPA
jgi:NNP family nitrate/nitrite transporter-like MFS transporter